MADISVPTPTDADYRQFRKILRTFCDIVKYNYEQTGISGTCFTTISPSNQKMQTEFNERFDVEDGWNSLPCLPDFPLNISLFNSGRYNTPGSAYINLDIINICALFAKGDGRGNDMGSAVLGFRAGINGRGPWLNERDELIKLYHRKDKTTIKRLLKELRAVTYNPYALNPNDFFTVEELGLHSDALDTTDQLKNLLNTFLKLAADDRYVYERLDMVRNEIYKHIKEVSESPDKQNLIFHGAPGTGKTYSVLNSIHALLPETGNASSETDEAGTNDAANTEDVQSEQAIFEQLNSSSRFGFVQFHPSYDYTDFVEGLRPNLSHDGFALQAGTFMKFCAEARQHPNDQYFFLIDEINRGDVSNIFGELFFLLDPGYRNVGIETQYSNMHTEEFRNEYFGGFNTFSIPKNVNIIGTMNDIDRSVDSFDFAMRRRFRFIDVTWEQSLLMLGQYVDKYAYERVLTLIVSLNDVICDKRTSHLGSDYALGASYFLSLVKIDKKNDYDGAKKKLWDSRIKPLLTEYLRGVPGEEDILDSFKATWDKSPAKLGKARAEELKQKVWMLMINSRDISSGDGETEPEPDTEQKPAED